VHPKLSLFLFLTDCVVKTPVIASNDFFGTKKEKMRMTSIYNIQNTIGCNGCHYKAIPAQLG